MKSNNHFYQPIGKGITFVCLATSLLSAQSSRSAEVAEPVVYADKLTRARLFQSPLIWVGATPPDGEESHILYQLAGLDPDQKPADVISGLESFLDAHPNSAWTPSLLANLARYYRSQGRYSLALDHWQRAWNITKDSAEPGARKVADYTIAYWTQLLSSLGRVDELQRLIAAVNDRPLGNSELQREFDVARRAAAIMQGQPGASFRCGTFALYNVARALNVKSDFSPLEDLPSPKTGFSMAELMAFSGKYQLELTAAKRPAGGELVVPSVVHWKENHYAAIVEKQNGQYKVIDPTFGKPQWLPAKIINENASGYFMVPTNALPEGWQIISTNEAEGVFGKGLWNEGDPDPSPPLCDADGNPCADGCTFECPAGSDGTGSGGGLGRTTGGSGGGGCGRGRGGCNGGGGDGNGMPYWDVQEPYISLWLHDRPMVYNMSFGRQFALQMDYHQRETRPLETQPAAGDLINFGPNWNCNLLTFIRVVGNIVHGWEDDGYWQWVYDEFHDPQWYEVWIPNVVATTSGDFHATEYCPDGGERRYSWGTNFDNTMDSRSHVKFNKSEYTTTQADAIPGYTDTTYHFASNTLAYPNGSIATFNLIITNSTFPEEKIALLTSATDPQGHTMHYYYDTSAAILLTNLVDFDGKTNHFVYGNVSFPTAVTQITNINYGLAVNFKYDAGGRLTNIVDVAGISSSFRYSDTKDVFFTTLDGGGVPTDPVTNSISLLTALVTPYGTNSFEYFHPTWPLFVGSSTNGIINTAFNSINRAITVTQPDQGKHLFMYRDNGASSYTYDGSCTGTDDFAANYALFWNNVNLDGHINNRDNSNYWGPRQYAALSTTVLTNLVTADFSSSRSRNWLHTDIAVGVHAVSPTLNIEQECSPDGSAPGRSVWYGYEGKAAPYLESTNNGLPNNVGFPVNAGGSYYNENISRNALGHPTNRVSFGANGFCNLFIKTNRYIYAANDIDLLYHIGPDGITQETYTYGGSHQATSMTDALGQVTTYTYNGNFQVTSISRPTGLITTNIYNSSGFLATTYDYTAGGSPVYYGTNTYTYTNGLVFTHTDERGLTTTNTWDKLQRLVRTDYPDNTFVAYTFTNLSLIRVVDRMNFTNSFVYDSMRRKTFATNALGRVTAYNYCNCGLLDSVRDAGGNDTYFTYDLAGRLTNTAYADGFKVRRTFNLAGQLISMTDSSGNIINNFYDAEMHLAGVTNTVGGLAAYVYDLDDRVTNSVDANGVSLNMTYDNLGRMLKRTYPDAGTESFCYSAFGLVAYTNQLNQTNFYTYDPLRRKTAETNANGEITQFTYDNAGDLLTLIDGKGLTNQWIYDQFGRVTNKVDAANNTLFVYKYDPLNRLTNRWSIAKSNTVYKYDPVGNLTNVVYLKATVIPSTTNIVLSYDALNRLTSMVDGVGATVYNYDGAGQLLSEEGPWSSDTVSYTYQNRLRTGLSVSAPNASAWTQSYAYDDMRRLTNVTSLAGSFGYDFGYNPDYGYVTSPQSLVQKLTLPNNAYITNYYDGNARLLGTFLRNSSDVNLDTQDYVYNQGNQRTQQVFMAGNYLNYTYDQIGQLKTAQGKEGSGTLRLQEQFGYVYDAAGNLHWRTNNALLAAFNVNNLNELTTVTNKGTLTVAGSATELKGGYTSWGVPPGVTNVVVSGTGLSSGNAELYQDGTWARTNAAWVNGNNSYTATAKDTYLRTDAATINSYLLSTNIFAYDLNGNMITNGTRVLDYDNENQLICITEPSKWKSEFMYDGKMRRRVRKEYTWSGSWIMTNEVRYVYDGNLVIQERDSSNLPQVTYTMGTDLKNSLYRGGGIGGLLARTENAQLIGCNPSATTFYHADGNGNVTALIYTDQLVAAKYEYDPCGNVLSQSGTLADANLYRFSSKELHVNSRMIYYHYRYYIPELYRWLNRDPIRERGGLNLYRFVGNNPIIGKDAEGLAWYGGYCGPGGDGKAIDELDAACQRHDDCYDNCGASGIGGVIDGGQCVRNCDNNLCNEARASHCHGCECRLARFIVSLIFCTTRHLP